MINKEPKTRLKSLKPIKRMDYPHQTQTANNLTLDNYNLLPFVPLCVTVRKIKGDERERKEGKKPHKKTHNK